MVSEIHGIDSNKKLNSVLAGVSGEYFVAAELSKRGYIASITLRNTKGVDILCSSSNATQTVGIQVKTNSGSRRSWILNQKAEDYYAENLYYIFVNLNGNLKHPDYFIVPSKIVANYCKEGHAIWLQRPGVNGNIHNDTPMRKFDDLKEEYLNKWDLLSLA
jgi:hypothetical protein